jgi:hypothetical protein
MAVLPNGDLVVSGSMTMVAGQPVSGIARWNGVAWDDMGWTTPGFFTGLIGLMDGGVVAAHSSLATGRSLVQWDGTSWLPMPYPPGATGTIRSLLELPDHDLIAFDTGPGLSRLDGSTWSTPGTFTGSGGSACAAFLAEGTLVVGGLFNAVNGIVSVNLARLTTVCPATFQISAAGCPSSGGDNALTASTGAWVGGTVATRAAGLPAQALVAVVFGFAPQLLPLATVVPQGQPGCVLAVTADAVALTVTSSGTVRWQIALPASTSLVGVPFYHQMVPFELGPASAVVAVTATDALRFEVGAF